MKSFKTLASILCLTLMCVLVVPKAMADDWNKETVVTFSAPVEVPGVGAQILPAGTYIFTIVSSESDRHIVRISSQDKTHVYTTILAIPNYRLKATDKTVITFRERPAGQPEALRAWFYPGRQSGEEFVYSKTRAAELAKETNEPVLATPMEMATAPVETLNTAPVEAVDPAGESIELAKVVEAPPADAPAPQPVAAAPAPAPVAVAAAEPLPETASSLPLIALVGVLAIGAGFGVSAFSKRVV